MKIAFLDRDGTIVEDGGPTALDMLTRPWVPGALVGMRFLQRAGFTLIVVTNQAAVGRGEISLQVVDMTHAVLGGRLIENGVKLTHFNTCPHLPGDGCPCRKPKPLMVTRTAEEFGAILSDCIMIGDKDSDIEAGKAAGVRATFQVSPMWGWNQFDLQSVAE